MNEDVIKQLVDDVSLLKKNVDKLFTKLKPFRLKLKPKSEYECTLGELYNIPDNLYVDVYRAFSGRLANIITSKFKTEIDTQSNNRIFYFKEIKDTKIYDLIKIKGFGRKSLNEIYDTLNFYTVRGKIPLKETGKLDKTFGELYDLKKNLLIDTSHISVRLYNILKQFNTNDRIIVTIRWFYPYMLKNFTPRFVFGSKKTSMQELFEVLNEMNRYGTIIENEQEIEQSN